VAWDGAWFRWAIAENGTIFGTKDYPEGQVYLNTQAWAVISGAATAGQARLALDTVRRRLASEWGVALCDPPFVRTPVDVMRAVIMNPGNKENGGIVSHTQNWAVLAEIAAGNGDQAYLPSAHPNPRHPYLTAENQHRCFSIHRLCPCQRAAVGIAAFSSNPHAVSRSAYFPASGKSLC
jgi:cellobiose phosphorylase